MTHSEFKDKAREHQIWFKTEVLGIPKDRSPLRAVRYKRGDGSIQHKEVEVRSSLLYADSKDGDDNYVIFYPGFRREISEAVRRSPVVSKGQMVTNLLRSEHIPYNIFFPMQYDLGGAKILFNAILGSDRIATIDRIQIEYNSGGLKDGTAFDVYVGYRTGDNCPGGIGIEVKYTEKEYLIKPGTKEWIETHGNVCIHLADNYRLPSVRSGWFRQEAITDAEFDAPNHVVANKFRQIWRNHILGASMILNGQLSEFTSLTVYPAGNGHFAKVLPEYEGLLTEKGKATFKHKTFEELFTLMEQSFTQSEIPQVADWIAYLRKRYIIA